MYSEIMFDEYFPRKPPCNPSVGDVPPTCLDLGMTQDCTMTRVGSTCNIKCDTGYAFKCYTDDTFTQYDDDGTGNAPADCGIYRCPALDVPVGDVKEGLAGRLMTQELVNVVKYSNLVRCEPEPCKISSDPAFRFVGARSDCTTLIGVGGANPVPRNPPANSSYPPTVNTSRIVGESCMASCSDGYAPQAIVYQCYTDLLFAPSPGGTDISCVPNACMQLPNNCIPVDHLLTMALPYLQQHPGVSWVRTHWFFWNRFAHNI